jgi:hypothetical protein
VEKYHTAGQATDDYMAHAHCMLGAKGYKYTHTHTQAVYYLLLFHCNNGSTNAPRCYVIRAVHCLSCYNFGLPNILCRITLQTPSSYLKTSIVILPDSETIKFDMDVACNVTTSVVLVVCSETVVSKDVALRVHSNRRLNIAWDIVINLVRRLLE